LEFKVSYDEFGCKAFIHSDSFPIPSDAVDDHGRPVAEELNVSS